MITKSKYNTMRKNHRALWQWLSDNPGKEKEDWPGWHHHDDYACDCFLCHTLDSCFRCPMRGCMQYGSNYLKWKNARSNRSAYALKIKNAVPVWSVYQKKFPEAISE